MVSQQYKRDQESYLALREAEIFSTQDVHHQGMICLFDTSIDEARAMDELISEYIDRGQYLIANHPQFWRQLFAFLPHLPGSAELQRHRDNINMEEVQHLILDHRPWAAAITERESTV